VRNRFLLFVLLLGLVPLAPAYAADVDPSQVFFPVQVTDELSYTDTYGECRDGCSRGHLGVDLMTPQMTPVFAAQSGSIYAYRDYCNEEGTYCSYYLLLAGDDGRSYFYVHLNDDTPGRPSGTCDHAGGYDNAVAPRLFDAYQAGQLKGLRVERGEHIGYAGSAGAGCGVDHIHFEVWNGIGWQTHYSDSQNPYPIVKAAHDAGNYWDASWPTPAVPYDRISGADRYATSAALSKATFDTSDTVVIAPGDEFVAALVGAPLAAAMHAPTLLVRSGSDGQLVPDSIRGEIERLGATYAVVIGGHDRVGPGLEDELVASTGLTRDRIRRIGGADAGELSANVAEQVLAVHGIAVGARSSANAGDGATVAPLLAAGTHPKDQGWPDALAASVLASRQLAPVLLTPHDSLHPAVARVIDADGISEVRISGGPQTVTDGVASAIEDRGVPTRRLAGDDRYATALVVAEEVLADGAALTDLVVATGLKFPDALAAGPALAATDRPMILVHGEQPLDLVRQWVQERAADIETVTAAGGPNTVFEDVLRTVAQWAWTDKA
jgi:putative cell wall-binding protein